MCILYFSLKSKLILNFEIFLKKNYFVINKFTSPTISSGDSFIFSFVNEEKKFEIKLNRGFLEVFFFSFWKTKLPNIKCNSTNEYIRFKRMPHKLLQISSFIW